MTLDSFFDFKNESIRKDGDEIFGCQFTTSSGEDRIEIPIFNESGKYIGSKMVYTVTDCVNLGLSQLCNNETNSINIHNRR